MWQAIKAHFKHSRTMFAARMYTYAGVLVTAWDGVQAYLQGNDFTPIYTRVLDFVGVPGDLRSLVISGVLALTGLLFAKLRALTTTPLVETP